MSSFPERSSPAAPCRAAATSERLPSSDGTISAASLPYSGCSVKACKQYHGIKPIALSQDPLHGTSEKCIQSWSLCFAGDAHMTQYISTTSSVSLVREEVCLQTSREMQKGGIPSEQVLLCNQEVITAEIMPSQERLTLCMSCCTRAGLSRPYSTAMSRSFGMSRSQALYSMLA